MEVRLDGKAGGTARPPLSRVVCLCHQAELPYRALFRQLDGPTVGPDALAGPIGKRMTGPVHTMPVVAFAAVQCDDFPDLPADVEADLSSDFRLLYRCARCVVSGDGTSVAHKTHGRFNNARWYTAQSRLLRLYMAEPCPTSELETLTRYVVTVYVPTVVAIKRRNDLVDAPRHLCEQIRRQQRHLSDAPVATALATVQQNLTGNAFMAHSENIVLAMLGDEDSGIRAEAAALIKDARQRRQPGPIRKFKCPKVNFDAVTYREMVDIESADGQDIEPPYVRPMSDEELEELLLL